MNKKILVVTVASTLLLPSVGQAAKVELTGEVELYGKVHLSVDNLKDGNNSSGYLSSNSSRLGVKGSRDFTPGLTGFFQLEAGVSSDGEGEAGDGRLFTRARDSFLGIKGSYGTLRGGRLSEGGSNAWVYDANLFADQVGDVGNFTGSINVGGRANNAIHYLSPSLGGLNIGIAHVFKESTAATAEGSTGVTLRWSGNGVALGAHAYTFGDGTAASDKKVNAVSAGYDFGSGEIRAMYVKNKNENNVSAADRSISTIGAGFKVGGAGGMAKVQYSKAGDRSGTSNTGATMWAVGYDHPVAKNTTAYVAYARADNKDSAAFDSNGYGHGNSPGVVTGKDPSGFSIGFVYDF